MSADVVFPLPLQRRKPLRDGETPADGDKRSLCTDHSMKSRPGAPVPPTLSSHLKNDVLFGVRLTVAKLRQRVPDFKCIPLEQIDAFSQFNIVGLIRLSLIIV